LTRLTKDQKELLIQWIAEGLYTDEINKRAARCADPFHVSRQQVDYYRGQCDQDIQQLTEEGKLRALDTGLALRGERVEQLKNLAETLLNDLLRDGKLWLANKKGVGSGPIAEIFHYEEFNKAEVDALRGVLDDIAREVGDRKARLDVEDTTDGEYRITFFDPYAEDDDAD
jgi:hypothetical protein